MPSKRSWNSAPTRSVTMAEAVLNDGQRLLAFNDFFVGRRSHVSARYNLRWRGKAEPQSSSGVLVATGAGSTGWLSSVFNMMRGVNNWTGGQAGQPVQLEWQDRRLAWVVRGTVCQPAFVRSNRGRHGGGRRGTCRREPHAGKRSDLLGRHRRGFPGVQQRLDSPHHRGGPARQPRRSPRVVSYLAG